MVMMLSKPVPSTSSEPVNNKLPTQEGEQTSQESARSNQALLKTVNCHGSQVQEYR